MNQWKKRHTPNRKMGKKDMNRYFTEEETHSCMKKHSVSLVIREKQIKPTVRYYTIAIQLANIKDSQD